MWMEDVEFLRALPNLIEHQHDMRNGITRRGIKTKRPPTTRSQLGVGDGVAARKERNVVSESDKCFGQVGNDPLRAAIKTRRNALNERSHLCDLHNDFAIS